MTQSKSHLRLRALCEGAIFIALAQVLSYLKLFELPQGGSITIEMLPIFLYCARLGLRSRHARKLCLQHPAGGAQQHVCLDVAVAHR